MSSDTILAVDLRRYKSLACAYCRATRGHAFRTRDTAPRSGPRAYRDCRRRRAGITPQESAALDTSRQMRK